MERERWRKSFEQEPEMITIIIFHPIYNATMWFIDIMKRMKNIPANINFRKVNDINELRSFPRTTIVWAYDLDN